MKALSILLLIFLVSCGKPKTGSDGSPVCRTLEEQKAICYVDEMVKMGHDKNMDQWVKNYCAAVYTTEGCYTKSYH